MRNFNVRLTSVGDYRDTEEVAREAFWNLHSPGCDEHYLLKMMRSHRDYCDDLDFVAEFDDKIVGNIVYTKSHVVSLDGLSVSTLTFGPVSVLPQYQRQGVGSILMETTSSIVKKMGIPAIIIFGHPKNYVKHGFVNSKKHSIGVDYRKYPSSLLVKVFDADVFNGRVWRYIESDVYELRKDDLDAYDRTFPEKKKEWLPSQEEFWIMSRSFVE